MFRRRRVCLAPLGAFLGARLGLSRFGLVGLFSLGLVLPSAAHAHGAGGAQLPREPAPVSAEGSRAVELVAALSREPSASAAAKREVEASRTAVARADGAALAGDGEGAKLLSKVALAWAEVARAVVEAAARESVASEAEKRADGARERVARAKTLLEAVDARRRELDREVARAEAELAREKARALEPSSKAGARPKRSSKKGPSK
jgi:hypothetical protein